MAETKFIGIETASEGGRSGCAVLRRDGGGVTVLLHKPGFRHARGLERLQELLKSADGAAVGSPLGYPETTMSLLRGAGSQGASVSDRFRFRVADLAMRSRFEQLELPTNIVASPTKVEHIWRNLLLLEDAGLDIEDSRAGRGGAVETSARLGMAELFSFCRRLGDVGREALANYRRRSRTDERGLQARRLILKVLVDACHEAGGKRAFRVENWRLIDKEPVVLDALFCALAAWAVHLGVGVPHPGPFYPTARSPEAEGLVNVPDWARLLKRIPSV